LHGGVRGEQPTRAFLGRDLEQRVAAELQKSNGGVPTVIVECAHGTLAPREVGAYCHEPIRGSTLVTLDATGHCPHLRAPKATASAIADFVDQL
jgi:pimeloyl-ACP methyl ester carboxylesterase